MHKRVKHNMNEKGLPFASKFEMACTKVEMQAAFCQRGTYVHEAKSSNSGIALALVKVRSS